MIEPVQRVPRYLLLLKAIAKKTSPEHPDYPHLQVRSPTVPEVSVGDSPPHATHSNQRALVAVDEAARHINDTVRDRECRDELKGLQARTTPLPLRQCVRYVTHPTPPTTLPLVRPRSAASRVGLT